MIEILSPGIMASVQDMGRPGWRNLGVGSCGAMDGTALHIGNLLVGNDPNLAGIEFTLGGFSIRFQKDTVFALTGADMHARLDDEPILSWWVRRARAGQTLVAGMTEHGMRAMLTVAGGIDVPIVMGSRSTDLKGGFGGLSGRLLQASDRLKVVTTEAPAIAASGFGLDAPRLQLLPPRGEAEIRFLPAAEWMRSPSSIRDGFLSTAWKLLPDSNRMGYRLSGPELRRDTPLELFSHGIIPGTIQLPPGGHPVIQLNDANTCGGYPKLGVVIGADLPLLAQVRLGSFIRFRQVDRAASIAASEQRQAFLNWLPGRIELARDYSRRWRAA